MGSVKNVDPMTSMWAWLAYGLRRYRLARGETLATVGRIMRVGTSSVSNYEAGERRPDLKGVKSLDEAWDTSGHFTRIFIYAQTAHVPDWFREHLVYEQRAHTVRIFEPLAVPGLFQTPEYARTALTAGGVQDIEQALAARLDRQKIFTRPNPPRAWVLFDEGVIDRPVGGKAVMCEQLAHLLEMSKLPHVVVRIVPRVVGYHMGLDGAFKTMSVMPEGDVAYTEASEGGRLVLDAQGVARFALRFEQIGADALGRTASRERIAEALESMT